MKHFIPIGSVVLLKNSQKRVMIVGVLQKQANTDTVWDYSGCLYPEGVMDPKDLYLFNQDQIERLYFIGYQNDECLSFLNRIDNYDEQSGKEKNDAEKSGD